MAISTPSRTDSTVNERRVTISESAFQSLIYGSESWLAELTDYVIPHAPQDDIERLEETAGLLREAIIEASNDAHQT